MRNRTYDGTIVRGEMKRCQKLELSSFRFTALRDFLEGDRLDVQYITYFYL